MKLIEAFWQTLSEPDEPSCIDDSSDAGSWAFALEHGAHSIRVVSDIEQRLDARLALRKAARLEPDPWKRGHITRAINAGVGNA